MSRTKHLHCDKCDTLTETKFRSIKLNEFGKDFEFTKVETETCPNCDEFYLSDSTLDECHLLIKQQLVAA